jgi:hypothetical protein
MHSTNIKITLLLCHEVLFAQNTEHSLVNLIIKYADKLERDRAIPLCLYFMNLINPFPANVENMVSS